MSDMYPTIADVSKWQGDIDWDTAKPYLHFAILRAQDGATADTKLARNVAACERLGIPYYVYGFYRGGGATEAARMVGRAEQAGARSVLGYVCDLEVSGLGKDGVRQFFSQLPPDLNNGLYIAHNLYGEYGVGLGEDWVWIPRYGSNNGRPSTRPSYPCDLWQFTSSGTVPGIPGRVDLNACMDEGLSFFIPEAKPPLPDALKGFNDLDGGAWYVSAVDEAVRLGYMKGYADGSGRFGPDDPMTRAQWVCALSRLAGADISETFDDVASSPYYYKALEWAVDSGVVDSEQDSFRPDDPCTRSEAAVMLWRLKGEPEAAGEPDAADIEGVPEFARDAFAWAVQAGVFTGDSVTGDLMPAAALTRAQGCAVLTRAD